MKKPRPEDRGSGMVWAGGRLLLLGGELEASLLAFEVGGAAFAFDVLVQLLAHGVWKCEGSMFQSTSGESSAAVD